MWQFRIYGMLNCIPSISKDGLWSYFDSISCQLFVYEILKDALVLLELAIWRSKITEQSGQKNDHLTTEMKMQCRADSVSMVNIIVPNVMSFLTDGER
jgi:hypothetical protein